MAGCPAGPAIVCRWAELTVRNQHRKRRASFLARLFKTYTALAGAGSSGFASLLQLTLHLEGARAQLVILGLQQPVVEPAIVLNRTQAVGRHAELEAAAQLFAQQRDILQVRQKYALGLVVGVANIVAHLAAFAGQFANTRHDISRSFKLRGFRFAR